MKQVNVKIVENRKIAPQFYKMRVESSYLAKSAKPGQFVEVKCSEGDEPLLRRPLGMHRILKNGIEILYEVVGKGTELLSKRRKGDYLDVIGPLGNGFDIKSAESRVQRTEILIAGGIGVAPLVALAQALRRKKNKVTVIIGAKTRSHIMCVDEFKSLGCDVKILTDDGSIGVKGFATDLLRTTHNAIRTTIYACGPTAMLKTIAKISEAKRIPCQVSLEERMACGVGVCLGCPVKVRPLPAPAGTKQKLRVPAGAGTYDYKMVCKDGPVFDAKEIAW